MALIVTKNGEISSSAAIEISAGVTGSLVISSSYLILSESAVAPATPASSKGVLYASGSDSHLYWKDDSGNVFDLAATSSSRTDYGTASIDPISPTPVEGDKYYNTVLEKEMRYDGSRSKWLSIESNTINFGRNGNTAPGSYYKGLDGKAFSATSGLSALYAGTVVALAYTRDDVDATVFEFAADGAQIAFISSSALSGSDTALNGDFVSDSVLSIRNQTGTNTVSGVQGYAQVKWRI